MFFLGLVSQLSHFINGVLQASRKVEVILEQFLIYDCRVISERLTFKMTGNLSEVLGNFAKINLGVRKGLLELKVFALDMFC